MDKSVSRRHFLGTAGALAATGSVLVMASTAGADEAPTEQVEVSEALACDVVVVGAGISGLAAAVEAADKGASVILLEKLGVVGGNGNITCGPSGFDTKWSPSAAGVDLRLARGGGRRPAHVQLHPQHPATTSTWPRPRARTSSGCVAQGVADLRRSWTTTRAATSPCTTGAPTGGHDQGGRQPHAASAPGAIVHPGHAGCSRGQLGVQIMYSRPPPSTSGHGRPARWWAWWPRTRRAPTSRSTPKRPFSQRAVSAATRNS